MNPNRTTAGASILQSLQRAVRQPEAACELAPARDFQLAFALTQLLIDSGRVDAAGCIVVATWQTRTQMVFEVICAERMRTPLCGLLAGVLSRPFHTAGTWLLSQHEAVAVIDLSAHANT